MIPNNITKEYILKAIAEVDKVGVPAKRQSRKYYLRYEGKSYPPKYIISLANSFANAEELDPEVFSGGRESNDFLRSLGFHIEGGQPRGKPTAQTKRVTGLSRPPRPVTSRHYESCPRCKEAVRAMLQAIYGEVEVNYRFDVGTTPQAFGHNPYARHLTEIHRGLEEYRGHKRLVKATTLPHCDFYVPNPGFVVEFDESQHFTTARRVSLERYPDDLQLGFDRIKWIALCDRIHARDNDPPYRDEQRAWYDTLRDFLPAVQGLQPTVRLFAQDSRWCSLDHHNPNDVETFKELLQIGDVRVDRTKTDTEPVATAINISGEWDGKPDRAGRLRSRKRPKESDTRKTGSAPALNITKLGIVSRDYRYRYANGFRDFSHTLPSVLKLLDYEGCDAVLFSLFSIIPRESYDLGAALRQSQSIKAVFLEEFQDGTSRAGGRYVVHHRTSKGWEEYSFAQVFGSLSGMPQWEMDDFVSYEMPKRILGNCCVLLCGESNGVKYSQKQKGVEDTFGLRAAIPPKTTIVLNPIHDRMTRFELKLKRRFLSEAGRRVISVWNKGRKDKNGKVKDGRNPAWTIFYDGKAADDEVVMIHNQLDVEIGVLDVKQE